jgi:Mn2+/Fe2+ NRAMP family transporter
MGTFIPSLSFSNSYLTALTAVFGTTISPYLFFWPASQEVQEQEATPGETLSNALQSKRRRNLSGCEATPTWEWHSPT